MNVTYPNIINKKIMKNMDKLHMNVFLFTVNSPYILVLN